MKIDPLKNKKYFKLKIKIYFLNITKDSIYIFLFKTHSPETNSDDISKECTRVSCQTVD